MAGIAMAPNAAVNSFVRACLIGILYFIGAWVGVTQTITPDGIAIIWPPNAVLLAALLLLPHREWPLIALAVLVAECVADVPAFPLWAAIAFGLVNIFEAVFAAFIIKRFASDEFRFESVRHVAIFTLAAPLLASSVAATLGAAVYEVLGRTDNSYFALWRLWWFGDALGLLLLTPLLVSAWHAVRAGQIKMDWRRSTELALVWGGLIAAGFYSLVSGRQGDLEFHTTPIMLLPFAIWAAVRFRTLAAAGTVAIIAAMATALLVRGLYPDAEVSPQYSVWLTQEYLAVVSLISIGLSVLMQEIRQQRGTLLLRERAMLASNDAIIITEVNGFDTLITWVNPKFEELFGYRKDEVIGQNPRFLQSGDREDGNLDIIRTAVAQKKPCRVQMKNYAKDDKPLWIDLSLAPVHDQRGRVTHYVGIHHDMTQQKETEHRLWKVSEALQHQNEALEDTVQQRTESLEQANSELSTANEQLQALASTDFLTGIANRRQFYDLGQRELRRLRQDNGSAALIALDLDHFKHINDDFGHEAGDEVLRQIVNPVKRNIRPADLFGRVGGEEFLILLCNTSETVATDIANRIRVHISQTPAQSGTNAIKVTASMGVAKWDHDCGLDELIRRADSALYAAKHAGRDMVRVWRPGSHTTKPEHSHEKSSS